MAREPMPTWSFAVTIVRKGDEFLLVHERKHGQCWYLPAGRVEPGESFAAAAVRETLEETGVPVRLIGILRVEHTPTAQSARLRVVFAAEPIDGTEPKSIPDKESLGAAWVSRDRFDALPLRGAEVRDLIDYVRAGGPVYPLSLLQTEHSPWRLPPAVPT